MRDNEINDAMLGAIHGTKDGYVDMQEFRLPELNATGEEINRAFVYLQVNGFIRFVNHLAGLDRLGYEAIYAGGYMAYREKQKQSDEFHRSVGRAAINANRLSRTSIITSSVLGLIAIGVSIYAAIQVGKAEENITKSESNVARMELLLRAARDERVAAGVELQHLQIVNDSLQAALSRGQTTMH